MAEELEITNKDLMNALDSITQMVNDIQIFVSQNLREIKDDMILLQTSVSYLQPSMDNIEKSVSSYISQQTNDREKELLDIIEDLQHRLDHVEQNQIQKNDVIQLIRSEDLNA